MLGNISKMLEMKKKAEEMKAKMSTLRVEKEYLGIRVVLTGLNKVDNIRFPEGFLSHKSPQEVEEMLVLAINAAQEELSEQMRNEFSDLTGGLGL